MNLRHLQRQPMNRWGERIPALHPDGSHVPEGAGRLAFVLLAGYVLVLPTAGTVALRNLLFFSALLLTLFAAVRWKLKLQVPFALAWIVYAAVALASLAHAIDPAYSLGEIKAEILYGIIATMLAGTWFTRMQSMKELLVVFVAGSVVMALFACWQEVRETTLGFPFDPARHGSLHSGAGDYSTYIVVVMPFLLGMLWRHRDSRRTTILLGVVVALNLMGAMITRNRAVFPAMAVETLVLAVLLVRTDGNWVRWRAAVPWIVLLVAAIGAMFALQMATRIETNPAVGPLARDPRWEIWAVALDNLRADPWAGSGFGRRVFSFLNPAVVETNGQHWHAHNVLLDKGIQMGVPGILAFVLLIAAAVRRTWLRRRARQTDATAAMLSAGCVALVAGLFVKNMTDDFFVRDQGYLFWMLVAGAATALEPLRRARRAPDTAAIAQDR